MNFKLSIAATAILAFSVVASYGQTSASNPPAKKHVATATAKKPAKPVVVVKAKREAAPTVEEQIQALRRDLESQINSLKTNLANKDEQLQKAEQSAADARAAAARAEAAASAQQQAVTDNTAAVTTLQTSVTDLKGNQATLATKVTEDESKSVKKSDLSDLAFGKVKIGATVFADWSYWSDNGNSGAFVDSQQTPPTTTNDLDDGYNAFELTRTYINVIYTPSDAATLRITPDIYRNTDVNASGTVDNSLSFRLKYAYIDLNKLFAANKYLKDNKITFGQTQQPLTDWEEGLTAHRYTYKMPMDYSSSLSSTYVGVKARGPIKFNGKEYIDYDLGVFTNGAYKTTELSNTKQFMGRATWYPLGTKTDRTGLGLTIFGDVGFANVAPSAAVTSHYTLDRQVYMVHYQTADKAYLITGQYDLNHNATGNRVDQLGYAFEGNARLGSAKSLFHAFGLYQHYEPNTNGATVTTDKSTQYSRTVGGIAYKFNKNLDISLADSNYHYINSSVGGVSTGKADTNVVSIFTQYTF
jgi:hypothetical protein